MIIAMHSTHQQPTPPKLPLPANEKKQQQFRNDFTIPIRETPIAHLFSASGWISVGERGWAVAGGSRIEY
jgi:hypothetical protein